MERIKELDTFQKGILLLLVILFAVFTPIYFVVTSREGYEYDGVMLYPSTEDGATVYAGKWDGKEVCFTVAADKTVTFRYGEKAYGPYTVREDPTAVPTGSDLSSLSSHMRGVEILEGDRVYFRGGVLKSGGSMLLLEEDGGISSMISTSEGIYYDDNGNTVDRMAPSPRTILQLLEGPELTARGDWKAWFYCVIASVLTAVSILYADELFRRNLSWRIQNPENAEPSDWELASRYISWTVLPIMTLIMYIVGLQT